MKLGIISDTHDRLVGIDAALKFFALQNVEMVIHCGDWRFLETVRYFAEKAHSYSLPVYGVLGNNDLEVNQFISYAAEAPGDFHIQEGILEQNIDDRIIAVYHGHHRPTLNKVVANSSYEIVLLGHTHKPKIEKIDGKLFINPGSTAFAIPRSKDWVPTVATIDTKAFHAEIHSLL